MSQEDKEWHAEQARVDHVVDVIEEKQRRLGARADELKQGIIALRKNFWEDVTVNIDEPDEIIETQASIHQRAELLSERERTHEHINRQLKTLERLKDSPYFGRIDFKEDGSGEPVPIYIGIATLMDEGEEEFLIYDWRAPISSLYYDYSPGPAQYETMDGTVSGEMTLKRQFIIKKGKIEGMFDTGVTIGDHLLQAVLGRHADTQMKSIVATIQKEQNRIIRNEKSKMLLVQGAAGSGKTSAALQRVAYLLYAHRKTLSSENMLLFSPNPLFNSYVSTVLPELGEENMKQTTYKEFVEDRLGGSFTFEDPFEQLEYYLAAGDGDDTRRLAAIRYKASLKFKALIDRYVRYLEKQNLIFKPITFRGRTLFTPEQIQRYFYETERTLTIPYRMEKVAERLLKELTDLERREAREPWVEDIVEVLDDKVYRKAYEKLYKKGRISGQSSNDFDVMRNYLGRLIVKKRFKPIRKRIKRLAFIDVQATYAQLFRLAPEFAREDGSLPDQWEEISRFTIEQLEKDNWLWEDVTPFLYLRDHLMGRIANRDIRHVFIDEAQDYTPFQLAYLKALFPNSKMTLLGDINQAIYAYALTAPSVLAEDGDPEKGIEKITLLRSYRSTRPIVEFTKPLIPGGERIIPFNRDGEKPTLCVVEDEAALDEKVVARIQQLQAAGHQTIAVIGKTMAESAAIYFRLKDRLPVQLLDKETYTFKKGIVVIPSYLAKGIEFDAVLVYNASKEQYRKESERHVFYTVCTRAMHELHLFSLGEPTPFLKNVPPELYTVVDE